VSTPLAFSWSWPHIDPASLDPTTVTVSRDPCGRWYVSFAVDVPAPSPLPAAGAVVGVDLGITDFAVTSDGHKIANPRRLARRERGLARYQRRLARCQQGSANRAKARAEVARAHRKSGKTCSECGHLLTELPLSTRTWHCASCGTRHDRDINAAKNIPAVSLAVSACGADVRHPGSLWVRSAVKQEPRSVRAGIPVPQRGE